MNAIACSDALEHLSACHDGELSSDLRSTVARHLNECGSCAAVLEGYAELSALVDTLDAPHIPPANWERFERALAAKTDVEIAHRGAPRRAATLWQAGVIAATLFVAVGIGWMAFRSSGDSHEHPHLAPYFSEYVEQFQSAPEKALQQLVTKYDGRAVDAKSAVRHLGYRPVAADRLPDGYTVEAMYVLRMPCCTCVQTLCRDSRGNMVAIFEHDDAQPAWFHGRPSIRCRCGGKECFMSQLDSRLAASWKVGTRYVTVVGAQDVDEVRALVTRLGGDG